MDLHGEETLKVWMDGFSRRQPIRIQVVARALCMEWRPGRPCENLRLSPRSNGYEQSKQTLRNIHPGEVLREKFLLPPGISQYRLAKGIGVTEARISGICSGKLAITADTALRLAVFFGATSGFWQGLQADYDTEGAAKELSGELGQIHRFEPMAA